MRLMLFVDGAPQQFYLDANGSQLTLGENGTAWMAEVVDSGDELQPVSLKFEPNIGQAGQTLCMLPVALVDAGYPAELNPNGLGEQELVVVSPQPLMIKTETDAEVAIDAHPIEFVESQEDMAGDETGARVFVYDGVTLPVPTLQAVDGNLNVHLRLNNPSYAYRISLFLNGEPVLLDGQLSVMVESTQEAVLLEYNIDVSKAPAESLIFAVAIPVGQACMRASNLAHVSQIKTVINDLAELSQSKK